MKKSLIALAALATVATAAQAQSSVTVYGVIDTGVASVSGRSTGTANTTTGVTAGTTGQTVTGLANGGLSTSRIGFKGTEDLGGGLKANFVLEAELLADDGSQYSTPEALFARESSVGLSGNFGALTLGRFNQFGYSLLAKFDALGGNNIGGAVATGNRQARIENAVQYVTPKLNGLQFGIQTGTRTSKTASGAVSQAYGEVAGENTGNRANSIFVSYDLDALELAYAWGDGKDSNGDKFVTWNNAFARYNFGVAKVVVGYVSQDLDRKTSGTTSGTSWSTGDTRKTQKLFGGVNIPVTSAFAVNAQVEQIKYEREASSEQKPLVYTLAGTYSLSKRTTAYGIYTKVNQDNGSRQDIVDSGKFAGFSGVYADTNKTGLMVGIRHTF